MQVCTEQMLRDIRIVENRLNQIAKQSVSSISKVFDKHFVLITEEDDKNLASDLVKLDQSLYWTDIKGVNTLVL